MRSVLARMARSSAPALHTLSPDAARAAYDAGSGILEIPKAELPRVEALAIPARDGHLLPARLYAPVQAPAQAPVPAATSSLLPVLLYFHGGGFTVGSIDSHDTLCRELARLAGCAVVSLGYRLAPVHRFPVASDDAWDATAWLAANARTLGLDPARLALGGDSAGGTLAAVCALQARDAARQGANADATTPRPVLQLLFYPGTAAWQDTASHRRFGRGLVLNTGHIDYFFGHYIDPADREDWRFAPLNAPDAEGVAPAWIGLAEFDPLVDEGLLYADKLRAAGVPVDIEIYRGVTHEFIKMGRVLPEARQAHRDAAAALRGAFGLAGQSPA